MKKRGSRGAIIAVLLVGILIFAGVYFAWTTVTDVFQPVDSGPGKTIPLVIQSGESTSQIADQLQAEGLIRNALAFRLWARIKGLDTHLQAGAYNLNTNMTIDAIINQLLQAQPDELVVAVPPGLRIEQIAQRVADAGLPNFKIQDFLKYTEHPNQFPDASRYPILGCTLDTTTHTQYSMEGLLFPDTYLVPVSGTARDVVNIMLKEFNDKVSQNHLDTLAQQHLPIAPDSSKRNCSSKEYQLYQGVILASIVEHEVNSVSNMPGVASVYWNRVYIAGNETANFLGADPTVQYARDTQNPPKDGKYWTPLNDAGKNIAPDSPWNTYTHKYWPPTPIGSPQLASLLAAINPPKSDNLYFLVTKDGHLVYAKTYQEFLQDEQKYPTQ
ncbi:MAG TPA: endolytic transglycosylase MltG [Ktedonobacteraceae bacterium]|nr:endolytic transglycosylase MltG [Ktedonobacteraceae bacterium]